MTATRMSPGGRPVMEDGETRPRPINPLYENALVAVFHASDDLRRKQIVIDFGLSEEQGRARRDVGVFVADVDRFKLTVNWTSRQHQQIPPGHILVEYGGEEVGLLCPFRDQEPVDGVPQQGWWKGRIVRPVDLSEACATEIAGRIQKPYMWQAMGGDVAQDVKAGRPVDNTPEVA